MTIYIVMGSSVTVIVYISISCLFKSKVQIVNKKMDAKLVNFLNEADEAYMQSYNTNRLEIFAEYATPELCSVIEEEMEFGEKKLFGTASSRSREWYLLNASKCDYTVKKILTHKRIKQRTVSISLGDSIEETWKVEEVDRSFQVCDII